MHHFFSFFFLRCLTFWSWESPDHCHLESYFKSSDTDARAHHWLQIFQRRRTDSDKAALASPLTVDRVPTCRTYRRQHHQQSWRQKSCYTGKPEIFCSHHSASKKNPKVVSLCVCVCACVLYSFSWELPCTAV